jgi:hypothetical protein
MDDNWDTAPCCFLTLLISTLYFLSSIPHQLISSLFIASQITQRRFIMVWNEITERRLLLSIISLAPAPKWDAIAKEMGNEFTSESVR